ncbi:protein CMSS1 [Platysternon megacephalum]|uniref:Protein CMSS1 n=1 Tax=Platysternon megacephalum TaxID=55544 RepID=A0A4D9ECR3_9SAUR|nr:protein CMSS1 [Platysternon megacephalum]
MYTKGNTEGGPESLSHSILASSSETKTTMEGIRAGLAPGQRLGTFSDCFSPAGNSQITIKSKDTKHGQSKHFVKYHISNYTSSQHPPDLNIFSPCLLPFPP